MDSTHLISLKHGLSLSTPGAERTADLLTSPASYGGAVSYYAHPCVVVYGTPVWIMPNGKCRVGEPNAPLVSREQAVRMVRERMRSAA
jgi:hypothetical protein